MKIQLNINSTVWQHARIFFLAASLALSLGSCMVSQQGDDGTTAVYQNYVPPPWAPPYDNVSAVRYYYFPDCQVYYDVWQRQFWYLGPGGGWQYDMGMPPVCSGMELNTAFIVLIDRDIDRPWMNHGYYRDNYPRHGYDQYRDIVVHNRIVTNIEPNHELVPRAFNENNNRVTFMQKPVEPMTAPGKVAPPHATTYHHVVHEVPMHSISPSMPAESRKLNYGNGYTKGSAPRGGEKR
jgi:hypothetical protein